MKKKLIIATGNSHKVEEFATLLAGLNFELLSAKSCGGMPVVDEDGDTFAANALIKAEALRKIAPTDAWILSDDSGLEVDALDGAPGIYSARYAGPNASDGANVDKLLAALRTVEGPARSARFRCVLALIGPDGKATMHAGACEGAITHAPSGASGFGYDPVFVPKGHTATFAELGESVKSALSHRAYAVEALRRFLSC